MDPSPKRPGVGDVIQLFSTDGTPSSALVMGVEDDGSLVIQMPDGETLQIWISPA